MVDPAVELPQHPFGGGLAGEKRIDGFDQVVEVETGARPFAALKV